MPRQTRQEIDDEIVDTAARLFARHGIAETSVQRIADAVGYSKGGLLRHYPSKEALQEAVLSRCLTELEEIAGEVADLAPGPDRDLAALTGLAHWALRRPGFLALLLSALARGLSEPENAGVQPITIVVAELFHLDHDKRPDQEKHPDHDKRPDRPIDVRRIVRVAGAVGALAVARTALGEHLTDMAAADLIDVSYDALGHPARQ
ncbi:TetR/AcrR family transcriptional regulator [Hamadaea tsunoensis]|uniref:TetR/AcrR family transcriptional regulator n=1 Tax=Hamadaea tsunoensis TaxID=53368 RepID=UPI0003FC66C0|nr:TetR/AcrR family transcriptional regulator [Hamadaea tsunoensis]